LHNAYDSNLLELGLLNRCRSLSRIEWITNFKDRKAIYDSYEHSVS